MVRLTARWRALTRSLWPSAVLGQPQSRPVGGALRHTGFGPHTRDASRLVLEHLVDRYRCFPFSVIVHHRAKMSWQSDQTAGQPKDTGVRSWSKIDSYTLWHAVAKLEADKRARAIVRLGTRTSSWMMRSARRSISAGCARRRTNQSSRLPAMCNRRASARAPILRLV